MEYTENRLLLRICNHRRYCIEQLIINRDIPGDIVELGIGSGKNLINMAMFARDMGIKKKFYACDTFQGLPWDEKKSFDSTLRKGHCYGITSDQLKLECKYEGLADHVIQIIGKIEDTLKDNFSDKKVSFIWFDLDLYDSTLFAYKFFEDKISQGGIIGFHDYEFVSCPGIKKIVDEEVDKTKFIRIYRRGTSIFFKRQ